MNHGGLWSGNIVNFGASHLVMDFLLPLMVVKEEHAEAFRQEFGITKLWRKSNGLCCGISSLRLLKKNRS